MKHVHDNPELYRYDLNNCNSATECTGLIQSPPQSDEELAAYNEIFHFAIPEIDKQEEFYNAQKGQR